MKAVIGRGLSQTICFSGDGHVPPKRSETIYDHHGKVVSPLKTTINPVYIAINQTVYRMFNGKPYRQRMLVLVEQHTSTTVLPCIFSSPTKA